MGEKFSWDRLMKRGKGAEEDNTINLVPERVEGPVAPLKAGAGMPTQPHKKLSPAAPPVVNGEAPPMNANRAPLVIDWEEFSKEEQAQNIEAVSVPPVDLANIPVETIEPIQIPPSQSSTPTTSAGNFWDQLNKQTQEAMGQPVEATNVPEPPKTVVTGWDDVELTPREQVPAAPSESDIMAGTLDPNGFQPISTFQRPTEEEIKQKTEAIAQSNAWEEASPSVQNAPTVSDLTPPIIQTPHPVAEFTPSSAQPVEPVAVNPVAPDEVETNKIVEPPVETFSNEIKRIDVGESPFMKRPPVGHYEVEDPFKPTGNKLLGAERSPVTKSEDVCEPVSTPEWSPSNENVAPSGFECQNDVPVEVESFEAVEPLDTGVTSQVQESPIETESFASPFDPAPQSSNVNTFDDSSSTHSAVQNEVENEQSTASINDRVAEMLNALDVPAQEQHEQETTQSLDEPPNLCDQMPEEIFEQQEVSQTSETHFEETAVDLKSVNQIEQTEVSATTEIPGEPQQATPEDFWASIPGAQPQAESTEPPVETPKIEETSNSVSEAVETAAEIESDLRAGDLLLKHKLVAPAQLERALARQRDTKEKLGQVLVSMGLISERRLLQVLASQKGVSPWHLEDDAPSQDALQLVSHETCQLFQVLPVAVRGDMLLLAMRETQDVEAIEAIKFASGKRVEPVLADEVRLAATIDEAYGVARERGESALEQMVAIAHEHEINLSDGTIVNPERPDHLNALLRELISDAKRKSATSITIGFGADQGEILYRIHGRLCPVQTVPADLAASVLKTAHAELEENRVPFDIGSDYKVAITTGQQGDNFVVTFPQVEAKLSSLDEMLIEDENLKLLRELTQRPYGLFLITGSVRSTKQATMKALSQEMEREGRVVARASEGENIAEQINLAVTSESEVIVVGELENEADIRAAVKAASSGHLILAEVTANDAPTAIQQLISCGADPYLLATILTGVWSQAIAPKLCLNCREAQGLTDSERSLLDHYGMRHIQKVFESNGCESCNHTGVAGQIVLSEVLPVSSDVSHLIANKAPVEEMSEQAGFAGYLPMDYDAMTRVIHGDVDFATAKRLVLFSLRELSAICRKDSWETQAS